MTTLWASLAIGAIYIIVATGYNVVYVATGTFNFAQAQFVVLGTFLAYTGLTTWGLPWWSVFVLAGTVGALVGVIEEIVAVRPVGLLGVHGELVTTIGFSVVIEGAIILIWGSDPLTVPPLISGRIVEVFGGRVAVDELAMIAIAIAVALLFHIWSRMTMHGLAGLAVSEDRSATRLLGISVRRLSIVSFAVAGALGGMAGQVVGPKTYALSTLGALITIKAFLALSIGGFGSYPGIIVGGFLVGIVEATTALYLGADYVNPLLFTLLLAMLLLRPTGLFGQRSERFV